MFAFSGCRHRGYYRHYLASVRAITRPDGDKREGLQVRQHDSLERRGIAFRRLWLSKIPVPNDLSFMPTINTKPNRIKITPKLKSHMALPIPPLLHSVHLEDRRSAPSHLRGSRQASAVGPQSAALWPSVLRDLM